MCTFWQSDINDHQKHDVRATVERAVLQRRVTLQTSLQLGASFEWLANTQSVRKRSYKRRVRHSSTAGGLRVGDRKPAPGKHKWVKICKDIKILSIYYAIIKEELLRRDPWVTGKFRSFWRRPKSMATNVGALIGWNNPPMSLPASCLLSSRLKKRKRIKRIVWTSPVSQENIADIAWRRSIESLKSYAVVPVPGTVKPTNLLRSSKSIPSDLFLSKFANILANLAWSCES